MFHEVHIFSLFLCTPLMSFALLEKMFILLLNTFFPKVQLLWNYFPLHYAFFLADVTYKLQSNF